MSACHTVLHHLHRAKDDGHAAVFIVSLCHSSVFFHFPRLYSAVGSVQGKQNVRIKTSAFDIRSITFWIKNTMVRKWKFTMSVSYIIYSVYTQHNLKVLNTVRQSSYIRIRFFSSVPRADKAWHRLLDVLQRRQNSSRNNDVIRQLLCGQDQVKTAAAAFRYRDHTNMNFTCQAVHSAYNKWFLARTVFLGFPSNVYIQNVCHLCFMVSFILCGTVCNTHFIHARL